MSIHDAMGRELVRFNEKYLLKGTVQNSRGRCFLRGIPSGFRGNEIVPCRVTLLVSFSAAVVPGGPSFRKSFALLDRGQ